MLIYLWFSKCYHIIGVLALPSCVNYYISSDSPPINHHPMLTRGKTSIKKPKVHIARNVDTLSAPKSWKTTLKILEWKALMQKEYDAFVNKCTLELIQLLHSQKVIEWKGFFR